MLTVVQEAAPSQKLSCFAILCFHTSASPDLSEFLPVYSAPALEDCDRWYFVSPDKEWARLPRFTVGGYKLDNGIP